MSDQYTLQNLPGLIAEQETKVSNARYEVDKAKLELNNTRNEKFVIFSAIKNYSDSTRRAKAAIETKDLELDLINAEKHLREQEIKFNRLVNLFYSVRKQTDFQIAEMNNL